jgi:CheY-like chemotaxis protein
LKRQKSPPLGPDETPPMSPKAYLARHPWTLELLNSGVTQTQLDGLHFRPNSFDLPFSTWSFMAGPAGFPTSAFSRAKRYCTLKWLILDDPPPSQNRDQAWLEIGLEVAAPIAREAMATLLEDAGCRVLDTFSGSHALQLLADHPEISILVTDVRMAGMTGIELAKAAQDRRPDLRVVLTSGNAEFAQTGGFLFVPKPWRSAEMLNVVRAAGTPRKTAKS